jgi:hypothetical protein
MQIWGGHGYIKQNNMEQIVRDARIAPVWEGTTGIQACLPWHAAKPKRCFGRRMSPAACVTRRSSRKGAGSTTPACVQALDLLGRKVMLQKIKPLNKFTSEIYRSALHAVPTLRAATLCPISPRLLIHLNVCSLQARIMCYSCRLGLCSAFASIG